jgi:ABC-2 type transport system ATP-binding protein
MPAPLLQVEGLTRRFGALTAVQDLSLEVYPGEIFGFLGPNGAGKTTSISMMCGLLRPDAGRVLLAGRPLRRGDGALRARTGVAPQNVVVWTRLTCLEQLIFVGQMYGLPAASARRRAEELLEAMGLAEKRAQLAATLSGGMQRRLNLILALVHDPEVLILDEPEAGLDPQSRVLVRDYVRAWAAAPGHTVILTSHNMDEVERLASRVAIIDHGRLLVTWAPEALKRQAGGGDVLEVDVPLPHCHPALAAVQAVLPGATLAGSALSLRQAQAIDALPARLAALQAAGIPHGEVRLRQTSLEDVFIALTGRRLRQ